MRATLGASVALEDAVVFPMTRYFFHVRHGRLTILDHCGVELADFAEVAKEAVRRALKIDETSAAVSESKDAVLVDDLPSSRCR